jgi:tetratricopeptide (TPR) repeat protein
VGLGNFAEAAANFDRAEEIYPRYILETEPWREQGWVNAYNAAIQPLNAGDLEGSAEIFEMANDLYSDRPEALLQLGSIYSQLNQTNESAEAFGAAMEVLEATREVQLMDTANADAWIQHWDIATMGYGTALMFAERFQEAADHYGRLIADDPDNVTVIGSLASVLSELGQADSVQALYTNLLSRTDLTERDYFNAGVGLYQIENWDGAAEAFSAAAEMNPFNRDARLNLAQTYMISERWALAVPACQALLEVDPRSQEGWTWLARSLSGIDDQEQAGTVITQYQEFGYHVTGMRLEGSADGGARISGQVVNTTGEEGQTVHLRFFFGGVNGQEVGNVDIRVQLPAAEMSEMFSGDFVSTEVVSGYRYEVIEG